MIMFPTRAVASQKPSAKHRKDPSEFVQGRAGDS